MKHSRTDSCSVQRQGQRRAELPHPRIILRALGVAHTRPLIAVEAREEGPRMFRDRFISYNLVLFEVAKITKSIILY